MMNTTALFQIIRRRAFSPFHRVSRPRPQPGILLLSLSLLSVASPGSCLAETALSEDWGSQNAGDTVGSLTQWQRISRGDDESVKIVEADGKKLLEIRQTSQEKWATLGIISKDTVSWNKELKISFDAAFQPEGAEDASRKASIVVAVGSGQTLYQLVIQPDSYHAQRSDPYRPNPDNPDAPSYTAIGRGAKGERIFASDEPRRFDLVFTKENDGMKMELFLDGESSPVASVEDSPATLLKEDAKVRLALMHPGWLRIGNVTVSAN